MNRKKILISLFFYSLFLVLGTKTGYGQQTPVFAEYNYNTFILNSAYAGFNEATEINLSNSGFFNNFEGSPRNFTLSLNAPLKDNKMGIGAGIIQDDIGVTSSTSIFGAYAYKIYFDFKSNRPYWQHYTPTVLSFGLTGGVLLYREDLLSLGIIDDPNFQQNINTTIPTIGLGFLFNHDTFYIGASAPNILGDSLASDDTVDISSPIYGYMGYRFFTDLFEYTMINPSVLLKHEGGAPMQIDLNLAFNFKNQFELGTGYRTNNSINLFAGFFMFKNIRAMYSYNFATNDTPVNNTHGFSLTYRFGDGFVR